jgi:hypothetical protein
MYPDVHSLNKNLRFRPRRGSGTVNCIKAELSLESVYEQHVLHRTIVKVFLILEISKCFSFLCNVSIWQRCLRLSFICNKKLVLSYKTTFCGSEDNSVEPLFS